ncbi:MAG TPA: hypothetical protein VLC09_16585 [Polyangiaceae bacterium]|nr:hypothetical protein [Polyangiaceae bacterium]
MKRRLAWSLLSALALTTSVAWADEVKDVETHFTQKTPEHVIQVLTSYAQTCAEGCKYLAPNVKQYVVVDYQKTADHWYVWNWITSAVKDLKYFNEVKKITKPDGTTLLVIKLVTDSATIEKLEKATGKTHQTNFDSTKSVISVRKQDDGRTKIVQDMSVVASGMMTVFTGQIKDGMKESAKANFANVEK